MFETITYTVSGMSCDHCTRAVTEELTEVRGVITVEVDLETKLVVVKGESLDDERLRTAIREAGYEAT